MTYLDSAKNLTITKDRAIKEVLSHSASIEEFFLDCGECDSYQAQTVLYWLGY